MKKHLKSLFSDSLIYGLSGVITSLIGVFLIPLYTKVFSPADYGVISILTTTSAFLNIFLIFGMDNSAAVWFWDKPEIEDRVKTFNTWLVFLALSSFLLMVLCILLNRYLSLLFFDSERFSALFLLIGVNLCFVGFQKMVNIWCRMLHRPLGAMAYSITILVVTTCSNLYFVLFLRIGVSGVFYSQVIASLLGFLLLLIFFKSWISLSSFDSRRLKEMLKLSLPLVPATTMYWLMGAASVYFLKFYGRDDTEVGLFQVGSSVANVLSLAAWAFFQAWTPFALSVSKKPNSGQIYSFVFEAYCVAGFGAALVLYLFAEDIIVMFTTRAYIGSTTVIGLLAVNVILAGVPNILSIANNLVKKTGSYAVAIGIGALITVTGFSLSIQEYGKVGVAVSMIAGSLFVPVYLGYKAQLLYYIPYNFKRVILVVGLLIAAFVLGKYLLLSIWLRILYLFIVIALLSLYYIRFYKTINQLPENSDNIYS